MKAIYASLGLAIFFLIDLVFLSSVNGEIFSTKDMIGIYYVEKCPNATLEDIKLFGEHLDKCNNEIVKLNEIIDEVDTNKNNSVKLFRKYCNFYPELYNCSQSALNMLKNCINPNQFKLVTTVTELQKFMCSEDGKRGVALIIEDGIECFNTTNKKINDCVLKHENDSVPESNPSFCKQLSGIRKCMKTNLETCSSKTVANTVEAFFEMVEDKVECKN